MTSHISKFLTLAGFAALACILLAVAAPRPALAHPHAWIDVKVKVLFDKKGRVYALEETWVFDAFYTAFAFDGLQKDKNGVPSQQAIDAMSKENFSNIQDFHYLTTVKSDGKSVAFAPAYDLKSSYEKDRLQMTFTLPLETPLDPAVSSVDYLIYDPTYYIEMLHAENGRAITLSGAGQDCKHSLTPPNPNPETIAFAAALDRTQSGGDGLGKLFAERVTIRCGV
ncbi:MAG: DUF1007 family protein [Pseudomonadota bacterium]